MSMAESIAVGRCGVGELAESRERDTHMHAEPGMS